MSTPASTQRGTRAVTAHLLNMGKHNGKARTSGVKVGSALVNKAKKVRDVHCPVQHLMSEHVIASPCSKAL